MTDRARLRQVVQTITASLRPGDRLYGLNGLTIRRFEQLLRRSGFEVAWLELLPLMSKANRKYEAWRMSYYAWMFRWLPHLPLLREIFTHRIVAALRKPALSQG